MCCKLTIVMFPGHRVAMPALRNGAARMVLLFLGTKGHHTPLHVDWTSAINKAFALDSDTMTEQWEDVFNVTSSAIDLILLL